MYEIARKKPVAKFYYKGHHSHPVRRTILVVKSTPKIIVGYELREGNLKHKLKDAPVKSFRRDKIAHTKSLRQNNPLRKKGGNKKVYNREGLLDLMIKGI